MLILACYVGKILVVLHLDRRGGDARAYVKSSALVTTGPYGWSRHPTYLLAMVQFVLWAALALYLQAFAPTWRWPLLRRAFGLPTLFFLINDRIVMPSEEAMLAACTPKSSPPTRAAFVAGSAARPRLPSRRSGWRRPWRCAPASSRKRATISRAVGVQAR